MDDLISEFITETTDSLAVLDNELVKLEHNPGDEATLGNIFRIMHTIKGTCGFLGLPRLESVAHASENVLGKIRDRKLEASSSAVSLVLTSLDNIKELIDFLSQNGSEPTGSDEALIAKLNRFADTGQLDDGEGAPAAEAAAPAAVNGNGDYSAYFKGDDDLAALIAAAQDAPAAENGAAEPAPAAPVPKAVEAAPAPAAPAPKSAAAAPAAPKAGEAKGESKDAAAQSIRVSLDVLENLMQTVSELVLTRNQLLQIMRTKEDREFLAPIQNLSLITSELQDSVMKTRMQPIGNAWSKFPRLVRDLSHELGKKIDLHMVGAETELDRQLLEMIKDPLTHMVRNSCDHGLEMPADRAAVGKPETGNVTLSAYHEGGHIIVEIADDGKGLNVARIREKAVANGVVTAAELENMSEQQIMQFIFAAGFSTAEKVTAVSGRGVGMDVVRTNIEKIGGTIDLQSEMGKGSTFRIKIPLTLAIVSVLIVEADGQKFAIPQNNVVELVRAAPGAEYSIETINHVPVMRLRDKLLPLGVLGEILGVNKEKVDWPSRHAFIAVCKVGTYDFGLIVDRVFDTEEIVVKPVAGALKGVPVYSGNTILGDGSVIMILDSNGVARAVGNTEVGSQETQEAHRRQALAGPQEREESFLLFHASGGAPKAVPLELVSRLEEIDVKSIEVAGDRPVVQYRGDLMRLIALDNDVKLPDEGVAQVIVFTYDQKTIGLVVDEILDIVHAPLSLKVSSKVNNCLGSMVINGKTTDVIDVASLLSDMIDYAVSNQQKASRNRAGPCELLFVEDSPFFRKLTEPFLAAAGYQVTSCESAQDALKELERGSSKFQIIVTDLEMPGMTGVEFAAACRANQKTAHIPVVAYTASMSDEVVERCQSAGIRACIVKTDRPGLLDVMTKLLNTDQEIAA